ncbi:MAG: hypothetical protein AAF674_16395 [Pseudomonadota bacterium]
MTEEERILAAGERALGLDRRDIEGPEGARHRSAWDRQIAPLADFLSAVEPPADLFTEIMSDLHAEQARLVTEADARTHSWRSAAILAVLLAVGLGVFLLAETGGG